MKHFILAFFLLFSAAFAYADSVTVEGLTEAQKAEVLRHAAQIKQDEPREQVNMWAGVVKELGVGLAQTAKEIGVAANEFVQTPVGKWTAALIIWKIAGSSAAHIFGGLLLICVVAPTWYFNMRHLYMQIEKTPTGTYGPFGFFTRYTTKVNIRHDTDTSQFFVPASTAACILAGILVLVTGH